MNRVLVASLVVGLVACASSGGGSPDAARPDVAVVPDATTVVDAPAPDGVAADQGAVDTGPDGPAYVPGISSDGEYDAVANDEGEVKFLLAVDGRQAPAPLLDTCIFQDTRRFDYHLPFLLHFEALSEIDLERYYELVLRRATRVWWGGVLLRLPGVTHPVSGQPAIVYAVWHDTEVDEATELLTLAEFVEIHGRLAGCMPFATTRLVLTPSTGDEKAQLQGMVDDLAAQGVYIYFPPSS